MKLHNKLMYLFIIVIATISMVACANLFPPEADQPEVGDVPPVTEDGAGDLTLTLSTAHEGYGTSCLNCHTNGAMMQPDNQPNHPLDDTYAGCESCHVFELR